LMGLDEPLGKTLITASGFVGVVTQIHQAGLQTHYVLSFAALIQRFQGAAVDG